MTRIMSRYLFVFSVICYGVPASSLISFHPRIKSDRSTVHGVLPESVVDVAKIPTGKGTETLNALLTSTKHVLDMNFKELSETMGGTGKSKVIWEYLREGIDPLVEEATPQLSGRAKTTLQQALRGQSLIPNELIEMTLSDCGTRKMLLKMPHDSQTIEAVLIPSYKHERTTLCVSTQIGCDRGCVFCLTGKMGLRRNLTSHEIIGQVIRGKEMALLYDMPPLTNVVFMGMGDAGRNMEAVGAAVHCLVDRDRMSMAQSKITISSVGPSPEAFMTLAAMPGTLAWSLHSADDAIRRKLVPSTRHTTIELRDGLMRALRTRPSLRTRTIMIALTLIDGINDSEEDARKLAEFVRPMQQVAPKIALDLIPYNDISVSGLSRPCKARINAFQKVLREEGFFVSVRITRGDSESSACGMLATERVKKLSATADTADTVDAADSARQ